MKKCQKQPPAVFWYEKVLLEILKNLQKNTCARVSTLIKFQVFALQLY